MKRLIYLLPFVLLIIFQLILIDKGILSISADESGHTLNAYNYYIGKGSLWGMWLPGQQLIYTAGFMVWKDLVWMPRIVSMMFGIFTLISLMLVTKELFKDKNIIVMTGVFGSLFVGINLYSVLPLTEIYFFAFILLEIYLMLYYLRTGKKEWLVIIVGIIATMFRYDGWVFILVVGGMMIKKLKYKTILLFLFPVVWVMYGWIMTGDMFGFIHSVAERRIALRNDEGMIYNYILLTLESTLLAGLFFINKNKKYLMLYVITFIIWAIALSRTGAMPTHNVWRVPLIWNIMMIPFLAYVVMKPKQKILSVVVIIIISLLFIKQTVKYISLPQKYILTWNEIELGKKIQQLDGGIIIPKMGWEYSNILVVSQRPERISFKDGINYMDLILYDYLIVPRRIYIDKEEIWNNKDWFIYKLKNTGE